MKKLIPLSILLSLLIFNESCKDKSTQIDYNPNVFSAKQYVVAEYYFTQIFDIFFMSLNDTALANNGTTEILSCTVSKDSIGNEILFDYGDYPRMCFDNLHRQGKYTAILTGDMSSTGSSASILIDTLLIEGITDIKASMVVVKLEDINGKPAYSLTISGGEVITPDTAMHTEDIIYYNTDFTLTWEEGALTPAIPEDDLLLFEGTAHGTSIEHNDFFLTVKEPIYNALDCQWMKQGIYDISVPGANDVEGTIDYITEDGCNYAVDFYFGGNRFYDDLLHMNY